MTPTMLGIGAGVVTLIAGLSSLPGTSTSSMWIDCSNGDAYFKRLVTNSRVECLYSMHRTSCRRLKNLDFNPARKE